MPDLTLPCLGGGPPVRLGGLRGTPVVLNVWASWCAPCAEEMPAFQELHERAAGRLQVLGVNYDDDPGAAVEFAAAYGVTYPSVVDRDGTVRGPLRVAGLPWTLLVDADGRVVHVLARPVREAAELRTLVAHHLGVRL